MAILASSVKQIGMSAGRRPVKMQAPALMVWLNTIVPVQMVLLVSSAVACLWFCLVLLKQLKYLFKEWIFPYHRQLRFRLLQKYEYLMVFISYLYRTTPFKNIYLLK